MQWPNTRASCLTPIFERMHWLRKMRPPICWSGNTSDCSCRKPPALSQRWMTGSRFSIAMSSARTIFLTDSGYQAPPLMLGSSAWMITSRPETMPMPPMLLARGRFAVIGHVGGERGEFEKRRPGVEQFLDPLARQHLALARKPFEVARRPIAAAPSPASRGISRRGVCCARSCGGIRPRSRRSPSQSCALSTPQRLGRERRDDLVLVESFADLL